MKKYLMLLLLFLSTQCGFSQEMQDFISTTVEIKSSSVGFNIFFNSFFTLSFVLLIWYLIEINYKSKILHYVSWGIFGVICVCEYFLLTILEPYFFGYLESLQGWGYIRTFLLMGFMAVMQVLSFFKIMDNIQKYHKSDFSLSLGFWAFGIGLALSVILGLIWGEMTFAVSLLIIFLTQPVQAVYIFVMVFKNNNILVASLAGLTYLIGFTITVATSLILGIVYLLFKFFYKVVKWFFSGSSSDDDNERYRRQREYENAAWAAQQEYLRDRRSKGYNC